MERRSIVIQGTVQGVGFRPFVYGLASRLRLYGFVRNDVGGVEIEVEGETAPLDEFLTKLVSELPPLARIDELTWQLRPLAGDAHFRIEASDGHSSGPVDIAPDVATCDLCLAELLNPADRRYSYPFINCTNCGPRLSIVLGAPYDRARTTMAGFRMCPACQAEYDDPANRRFHAQPNACPVCGPRLQARDAMGDPRAVADPLAWFMQTIREQKIGALKGLGGYHLVCDARSAAAVAALRQRKQRDEKPFAVMVADLAMAAEFCELSDAERELLTSSRRPIVVLLRKQAQSGLAEQVAPGNPYLGVMLPYTPLHHLLLRGMGRPLVMTSGNRSDEPIAFREPEAFERLGGIADVFLTHNRPIHVRCDDSVTRLIDGIESPIRRSRGYAPRPIPLPMNCPAPILAVGGQMKGTFALGSGRRAILSQHMGDLDHLEAFQAFQRDVRLYEQLFSLRPSCIVHDLHPDYASTRYAMQRAESEGIQRIAVQHHHAHLASCMAENGLSGPVLGVSFDGTGYGTDGKIWGGEFLLGDYRSFHRAAHLRYIPMPGGAMAVRQPWRMASAYLVDAGLTCETLEDRIPGATLEIVRHMLARRFNCPETSSVGRLFDAVASLIGVRDTVNHEGQAAMQLEWLAATVPPDGAYAYALESLPPASNMASWQLDMRPTIHGVVSDLCNNVEPARMARRFHSTIADAIVAICTKVRESSALDAIVLSGGVFMNVLLTREVMNKLSVNNFKVYRHRRVPPNDGGLCLGQLAVAASQMTPA